MSTPPSTQDPRTPRATDAAPPEDGPIEGETTAEGVEGVEGGVSVDPVDHEREHGVPPESNDDYDGDEVDHEGADSFPASDPPGGW